MRRCRLCKPHCCLASPFALPTCLFQRRRLGQPLLELLCYTCLKSSKHWVLSPRGDSQSTRWIGIPHTLNASTGRQQGRPTQNLCSRIASPKYWFIVVFLLPSVFRHWMLSVCPHHLGCHNLAAMGSNSTRAQDKLWCRRIQGGAVDAPPRPKKKGFKKGVVAPPRPEKKEVVFSSSSTKVAAAWFSDRSVEWTLPSYVWYGVVPNSFILFTIVVIAAIDSCQ
jgi:hypothetical protein